MNGYVEAGYVVVLGPLSLYGVTLVARERAARRRVGAAPSGVRTGVPTAPQGAHGDASLVNRGGAENEERGSGS
jgi:hypothetical protein